MNDNRLININYMRLIDGENEERERKKDFMEKIKIVKGFYARNYKKQT